MPSSHKRDIDGVCKDCQKPFVFTVEEQERFDEINQRLPEGGKLSPPKRCKPCRSLRRNQKNR